MFPSPTSGILFICAVKLAAHRQQNKFPSPTSGILFIFMNLRDVAEELVFPSPTSGILFIFLQALTKAPATSVSVPNFGDSFYI